jgi:hypothetical protein
MVKFAKEIPSIQRLHHSHHHHDEDGVIQSSNETISKEKDRQQRK